MAFDPVTDRDIRITWDTIQGGYHVERVIIRGSNGNVHPGDICDIPLVNEEDWESVYGPALFSDACIDAFSRMTEDNVRCRNIDLGPRLPSDPAVIFARDLLNLVTL